MKLALRPQNIAFVALFTALRLPSITGAATLPAARLAAVFTDFDEGKADGNAYRVSVARTPSGDKLITQQMSAAQSAATANPATASYFQGYIIGLQSDCALTTMVKPQP